MMYTKPAKIKRLSKAEQGHTRVPCKSFPYTCITTGLKLFYDQVSVIVKDDWTDCEKNIMHLKNQKDWFKSSSGFREHKNKWIWGKKYILNNFCGSNLHPIVQK